MTGLGPPARVTQRIIVIFPCVGGEIGWFCETLCTVKMADILYNMQPPYLLCIRSVDLDLDLFEL